MLYKCFHNFEPISVITVVPRPRKDLRWCSTSPCLKKGGNLNLTLCRCLPSTIGVDWQKCGKDIFSSF